MSARKTKQYVNINAKTLMAVTNVNVMMATDSHLIFITVQVSILFFQKRYPNVSKSFSIHMWNAINCFQLIVFN